MVASLMRPSPRYQPGSIADATPMDSDGARARSGRRRKKRERRGLESAVGRRRPVRRSGNERFVGERAAARNGRGAPVDAGLGGRRWRRAESCGRWCRAAGRRIQDAGARYVAAIVRAVDRAERFLGQGYAAVAAHRSRRQAPSQVAPMARAHPVHMGAPLPRLAVATPTALLQGLCASGTARLAAPGANDDKDFRDPAPLSSRTGRRAGNSNCSSARTTPLTSAQPSARVISPHDMCRGMVLLEEIGRGRAARCGRGWPCRRCRCSRSRWCPCSTTSAGTR